MYPTLYSNKKSLDYQMNWNPRKIVDFWCTFLPIFKDTEDNFAVSIQEAVMEYISDSPLFAMHQIPPSFQLCLIYLIAQFSLCLQGDPTSSSV